MAILAVAGSLWHFWAATILMGIGYDGGTVATAFVADLIPPRALGRGVALLTGMGSVGLVVGLAGAGYAVQKLGVSTVMRISAALPLIGIALVSAVREPERRLPGGPLTANR